MTDVPPAPEPIPEVAPPAYAPPAYSQTDAPQSGSGYAQPYGQGYAAPPKTNTLAIISLVLSLAGLFIPGGSIAGIVTGHISLGQIKRTGESGHGLGLAGTIIGWVVTGLGVIGVVIAVIVWVLFLAAATSSGTYSG